MPNIVLTDDLEVDLGTFTDAINVAASKNFLLAMSVINLLNLGGLLLVQKQLLIVVELSISWKEHIL